MKRLLNYILATSMLVLSVIGVSAADHLDANNISIEDEIQMEYESTMKNIAGQLFEQNKLDELESWEDIIYSLIRAQVYAEHNINDYSTNPLGSEDDELKPPTYTMEYVGVVKYTQGDYRVVATCLDRISTYKYVRGFDTGVLTRESILAEVFKHIFKKEKPFTFIPDAIVYSQTYVQVSQLLEAKKRNGQLVLLSKENLKNPDADIGHAPVAWLTAPSFSVPENATLWIAGIYDENYTY